MAKNSATVVAQRALYRGVSALDGVGVLHALQIGGGDQQHREVDRPGDEHREADVVAGDPQESASRCAGLGVAVPVAGKAGVQVDGVRHHGRAEHGGGEQDALRAVEPGKQAARHVRGRRRCDEQAGEEADRDDGSSPLMTRSNIR